jgi:hypothetical protein
MRARRAHHARSTHSTHLERLENDEAADDGVGRGDGGHDLARDLLDVPPRLARDVEDLRAQVRGGGHEVERLRVVLIELQPAALLGEVLGAFGVHGLDGAQEHLRAYSLQVCPCPCPCRGWTRWSKAALEDRCVLLEAPGAPLDLGEGGGIGQRHVLQPQHHGLGTLLPQRVLGVRVRGVREGVRCVGCVKAPCSAVAARPLRRRRGRRAVQKRPRSRPP